MFYSNLTSAIKNRDISTANKVIMSEVGDSIVNDRDNFIEVLRSSNIRIEDGASDSDIVHSFIGELPTNDDLMVNTSYYVNHKNSDLNFDGSRDIDGLGVKACHKAMKLNFDAGGLATSLANNAGSGWGGFANTLAQTGAGIYSDVKNKKNAFSDSLAKQKEAKNEIVRTVLAQRQAQVDAKNKQIADKQKTQRTMLIVGGVGVVLLLGFAIYKLNK
jgi:hypothetical protein